MGLIGNILISVIHLALVAIDVLLLMILLKIIYERWQILCLKPIVNSTKPLLTNILIRTQKLALTATGRSYSEKTLLVFFALFIWFLRFVITGLL